MTRPVYDPFHEPLSVWPFVPRVWLHQIATLSISVFLISTDHMPAPLAQTFSTFEFISKRSKSRSARVVSDAVACRGARVLCVRPSNLIAAPFLTYSSIALRLARLRSGYDCDRRVCRRRICNQSDVLISAR